MKQSYQSSPGVPPEALRKELLSGPASTGDADHLDPASSSLARRALLTTLSLSLAGGCSGLISAHLGLVSGAELVLVVCSITFSASGLATLLFFRRIALQTVATASTIFFALNLGVGALIAVCGSGEHLNFFVYLLWFFPLLVFNKLVNEPSVGRLLAKILFLLPLLLILCLAPRWLMVLRIEQRILLGVYGLSYTCYGLALNLVSRYREKYIVEQERMESLKVEAGILESISDCFISLDSDSRLIYLNDAACTELGVDRQIALNKTLSRAAPGFLSQATLNELKAASARGSASFFEAEDEGCTLWYDLRCFPRPNGMSIYFRDITGRKANEARVQYLAFYDVLTKLPNRQFLRDRLCEALTLAASEGTIGALLYVDLDDFKTVNDTMGHDTGDLLLQQVAHRLTACMRPDDLVARIGGDEFVVMLSASPHRDASAAMAKKMGERILGSLRQPFVIGAYESETTASIGITFFSGISETVDDLLKRTDLAMYSAKAQGRNDLCFFDHSMQTAVETRAALRFDLRRALQNDEFELHYQPQLDSDGVVTGAEALLRWFHPQRGRVSPDIFIPLAEEAGLIVELGRWVLETACIQLSQWSNNPKMQKLIVSVNVSMRQFLDPQFVSIVRTALAISGANPYSLKLEITESSFMEKADEMIAKMHELKVFGIGFSLDDFGTGYSSLSYLKHLPLDQLKIDRSFVNNVLNDSKDASIARTIIALGCSLNLSVIAEGVETAAQRDFLEAEGCHAYQGFLYSPAVSASKFESFVAATHYKKMHIILPDLEPAAQACQRTV